MYTIASESIRSEASISVDPQSSPESASSPVSLISKKPSRTQLSARGIKISSGGTLGASSANAQAPSSSNPFYTAPHEKRPPDDNVAGTMVSPSAAAAATTIAVAPPPVPPPSGQPPSPPPPPAIDEDTMSVPANVDEVAMLNNAKKEDQRSNNGATPSDEDVTEDMVRKGFKMHAFRAERILKST